MKMFYLLINQLGWLAFTALLIVVVVLYVRINRQIGQLRRDVGKLQTELVQQKVNHATPSRIQSTESNTASNSDATEENLSEGSTLNTIDETNTTAQIWPPLPPTTATVSNLQANSVSNPLLNPLSKKASNTSDNEPTETLGLIKNKTPTYSLLKKL